jgi:hypothetical protein
LFSGVNASIASFAPPTRKSDYIFIYLFLNCGDVFQVAEEEMSIEEKAEEKFWMNLARRYWYFIVIFILLMAGAIVGLILTLDWYVKTQAIGGFGAWTFNEFSFGEATIWCIFLFLWTLLFVGLPTLAVAGLIFAIAWFVVLPPEVKAEIKAQPKKVSGTKRSGGGGGFTFLLFVGVCIKVFLDGNWFTKFALLPFSYFVYTWLFVLVWALIIFGIPAAIIGVGWLIWKGGNET